jgi:hypothetical protein
MDVNMAVALAQEADYAGRHLQRAGDFHRTRHFPIHQYRRDCSDERRGGEIARLAPPKDIDKGAYISKKTLNVEVVGP